MWNERKLDCIKREKHHNSLSVKLILVVEVCVRWSFDDKVPQEIDIITSFALFFNSMQDLVLYGKQMVLFYFLLFVSMKKDEYIAFQVNDCDAKHFQQAL